MPTLAEAVKKNAKPAPKISLWEGPCGEGPQGGVTYSLLSRYLACPERFRVKTVEGLSPKESFSAPMEYGNMWHACEEAFAGNADWNLCLDLYASTLCKKFPLQQQDVQHWHNICRTVFPIYAEHWKEHPDVEDRTPLLQEAKFDVKVKLPEGRVIRLRGKWDSVDLIDGGVWLQENKTKSSIDGQKVARQLAMDAQTMLYIHALDSQRTDHPSTMTEHFQGVPILGVRYNVVRRSAHKSVESLTKKIEDDQAAGRIGEWFGRWKVEVTERDRQRFLSRCLYPVLENLADDYEWWTWCYKLGVDSFNTIKRRKIFPEHRRRHFVLPYNVYNPVSEGGFGDVDEYLTNGSTVGLRRAEDLFPELK